MFRVSWCLLLLWGTRSCRSFLAHRAWHWSIFLTTPLNSLASQQILVFHLVRSSMWQNCRIMVRRQRSRIWFERLEPGACLQDCLACCWHCFCAGFWVFGLSKRRTTHGTLFFSPCQYACWLSKEARWLYWKDWRNWKGWPWFLFLAHWLRLLFLLPFTISGEWMELSIRWYYAASWLLPSIYIIQTKWFHGTYRCFQGTFTLKAFRWFGWALGLSLQVFSVKEQSMSFVHWFFILVTWWLWAYIPVDIRLLSVTQILSLWLLKPTIFLVFQQLSTICDGWIRPSISR